MALTRRNTLIGLGTLAGGFGLISATGAFDTVAAERDFEVDVADDSDALLQLQAADNDYAEEDDGMVGINIDNLNENAVSTLEVFDITNDGTQAVGVSIDETPDGIDFQNPDGESLEDPQTLEEEGTLTVMLEVDTGEYDAEGDTESFTITADADQAE